LGAYPLRIKENTLLYKLYGVTESQERHRHRYEVNPEYISMLENKGLIASGISPDGKLVEAVELEEHLFFVGCQYHPEFKSRPNSPHPIFRGFITASLKK